MEKKKKAAAIGTQQSLYHLYNLDDDRRHFPYEYETNALQFVAQGDFENALRVFEPILQGDTSMDMGTFANNPRKQAEYSAVITISVLCRTAIQNGVDPLVAYDRNDLYLQQVSDAHTENEYLALTIQATKDICALIRRQQQSVQSLHIRRCKQFVYSNLTSHLTVQAIADSLNLNVTYLSGLFREHEGVTLKQYILAEKTRAAQDMLTFSDASIDEIADRLCFSSCGHFSSTFKKLTGQTPTQYRAKTRQVNV